MKMMIKNKKAMEMTFVMLLIALIFGLVVMTIMLELFTKTTAASKDAVAKAVCSGLMGVKKASSSLFGTFGTVVSGQLFSLGPACGNAYTMPCEDRSDCISKIQREIDYCWEIGNIEEGTSVACLYTLEMGPIGDKLCKSEICGTGDKCTDTETPNKRISFKNEFCLLDGDSLSLEFRSGTIYAKCMGVCETP